MRHTGNNRFRIHWVALLATALLSKLAATEIKVPKLASMPEVSRIWMGMEEGSVRPASYQQVRAEMEGPLVLHSTDGDVLKRGTHWATLDAAQLELENETISLEELKLERQLRKAEDDAEEARLRNLLEIRETEKKLGDLKQAIQTGDIPDTMRRRAMDAASELESRLSMLKRRVDPQEINKQLQADRREAELQLERKRKQYEQLRRRSYLTAENDGLLRLSDGLKDKIKNASTNDPSIWIKPGEHLATIADDANLEILVSAAGQVMSQIPLKEVTVLLQDGRSGKLIEGSYLRTEEVDSGVEIIRSYVFSVPPEAVADARAAMGQRHLVHVYRKLPNPFRLVHKRDIAFLAPHILESGGWDGLARHLWPTCTVVQVGPQTLAIDPGDAN